MSHLKIDQPTTASDLYSKQQQQKSTTATGEVKGWNSVIEHPTTTGGGDFTEDKKNLRDNEEDEL